MANRSRLHFNHFDEFKAWLDGRGIEHRPGVPPYQALRIRTGDRWAAIYERSTATQHFTIPSNLDGLVSAFMRERKGARDG